MRYPKIFAVRGRTKCVRLKGLSRASARTLRRERLTKLEMKSRCAHKPQYTTVCDVETSLCSYLRDPNPTRPGDSDLQGERLVYVWADFTSALKAQPSERAARAWSESAEASVAIALRRCGFQSVRGPPPHSAKNSTGRYPPLPLSIEMRCEPDPGLHRNAPLDNGVPAVVVYLPFRLEPILPIGILGRVRRALASFYAASQTTQKNGDLCSNDEIRVC